MAKWVCIRDCVWGEKTKPGDPPAVRQWRVGETYDGVEPAYMTLEGEMKKHPYFQRLGQGPINKFEIYKKQLDEAGFEYNDENWDEPNYKNAIKEISRQKNEEKEIRELKEKLKEHNVKIQGNYKLSTLRRLYRTTVETPQFEEKRA